MSNTGLWYSSGPSSKLRSHLSLTFGFILRTVLVSATGIVLAWLFGTWDTAVNAATAAVIGVLLANTVVVAAMFLVQVIRASRLIHMELASEIVALKATTQGLQLQVAQKRRITFR